MNKITVKLKTSKGEIIFSKYKREDHYRNYLDEGFEEYNMLNSEEKNIVDDKVNKAREDYEDHELDCDCYDCETFRRSNYDGSRQMISNEANK